MTAPDKLKALEIEIGSTIVDGINDDCLEYVLRRGYAAMGIDPNIAGRMIRKLAECQMEDHSEALAALADPAPDRSEAMRERCVAHLRRSAEAKESASRGGMGGMFASQSATDLRIAANEIRALPLASPNEEGGS